MNGKEEFFRQLRELGLDIKGPIWPELFQRSRFRRLVMNQGLGQAFNWFIHKFVVVDDGAGAPKLRNLHVHNGSGRAVRKLKVDRKDHDENGPPAPLVPPDGDILMSDEWAINDNFDPSGHLPDVEDLSITLEMPELPGQVFRGVIEATPGEFIETVWLNLLPGLDGFQAEVVLWVGQDESNVHPGAASTVQLTPVP